jgi:hypothetical protein
VRLFGIHKNTVRNWLKHGLVAIRRSAPDFDPRPRATTIPARAPTECEADVRPGAHFLHRVPHAKVPRRKHGGLHPDEPLLGKPVRHLP